LSSRGRSFDSLTRDWWSGWRFRTTTLNDEYTLDNLFEDRSEDMDMLLMRRPDGALEILQPGQKPKQDGSAVLTFSAVKDTTDARGQGAQSDGLAGPVAPLPS
jgi:hypothetical protein